jgi:hypothetical protein
LVLVAVQGLGQPCGDRVASSRAHRQRDVVALDGTAPAEFLPSFLPRRSQQSRDREEESLDLEPRHQITAHTQKRIASAQA